MHMRTHARMAAHMQGEDANNYATMMYRVDGESRDKTLVINLQRSGSHRSLSEYYTWQVGTAQRRDCLRSAAARDCLHSAAAHVHHSALHVRRPLLLHVLYMALLAPVLSLSLAVHSCTRSWIAPLEAARPAASTLPR